jgi:hypothetical protein
MNITMQNLERLSLAEMKEFVEGSRKVGLATETREEAYGLVETTLQSQRYRKLSKGQKGIVRRFLVKVIGLSRSQMTRLVGYWIKQRCIPRKTATKRRQFARRYTAADIRLLASVDAAHEDLSGPGVRHILQREFTVFGELEFENLAGISASHIYNLRESETYAGVRVHMTHTQARQVSIGERRKPDPKGQPGYLRVDTVHQGHHDGEPGGVSHQRGGYGDAMAGGGLRRDHLRKSPGAGAREHAPSVSVPHFGLSLRQRIGVHQS